MFIPDAEREEAIRLAYSDICSFLNDRYSRDTYAASLDNALRVIRDIDNQALAGIDDDVSPVVCITEVLNWLEGRCLQRAEPWERTGIGFAIAVRYSPVERFLQTLLNDFRNLGGIKSKKYYEYKLPSAFVSSTLGEFLNFIVEERGYTLADDQPPWDWGHGEVSGFASWLVIYTDERTAYILTDDELLGTSSEEDKTVCAYYESLKYHELGHFRNNLEYYENAEVRDHIVTSEHSHETSAWIYATTLKGAIIGVKARLSRLIGDVDNEWKS